MSETLKKEKLNTSLKEEINQYTQYTKKCKLKT